MKEFFDKYKFWIIGGVLAVIILPKIFRFLTSVGEVNETEPGNVQTAYQCQTASADRNKPFSIGTKDSNEVCYLQLWLNTYKNANLKKDGAFGPKTQAAALAAGLPIGITNTLNSLSI